MKFYYSFRPYFLLLSFFILAGCSSKLPQIVLLKGVAAKQAHIRLEEFLNRSCPEAVDSDVRVGWQAYGKNAFYAATLQAAYPSFVRFAVVDPLNRPQILLVANGERFTFADNRSGEGVTGRVDADFFSKYVPPGISARELFTWLSAQIKVDGLEIISENEAVDGSLFWYEIKYDDTYKHMLGLDQQHLLRHLVLDQEDNIVLDVQYSEYTAIPTGKCDWPGRLKVDSQDLRAAFTLVFLKNYSFSTPAESIFQLKLPSHFMVQEVQ